MQLEDGEDGDCENVKSWLHSKEDTRRKAF
jgi:hypothetical protein